MRYNVNAGILVLWPLLAVCAAPASTVEHPGVVHKEDNCSSCHPDKIRGKSVHTAMVLTCTTCHLAQTRDDMTTLELALPKEQICFACHAKAAESQQHSPVVKGPCMGCHDAHSSSRRMLLLERSEAAPAHPSRH